MTTFDSLAAKYGTYTKDGVDYTLEQHAYPDTNAGSSVIGGIIMPGENYYTAAGFDRAGNSVQVVWKSLTPIQMMPVTRATGMSLSRHRLMIRLFRGPSNLRSVRRRKPGKQTRTV